MDSNFFGSLAISGLQVALPNFQNFLKQFSTLQLMLSIPIEIVLNFENSIF